MICNDAAVAIIKEEEGMRLSAYLCPAGVWTIGYGHTGDVKLGDKLKSEHVADTILREIDIPLSEAIVERAVKRKLNGNQFSALVSFVFNVGAGRKLGAHGPDDLGRDGFVTLATGRPSRLLECVNVGAFKAAAAEFGKWVHSGGKVLPGLVRRRQREAALFLQAVN